MAQIGWDKALSVGIRKIDADHRRIFDLINKLDAAIGSGASKSTLNRILSDLLDCASGHFANEEKLMQETGYPEYASHKSEHERIAKNVKELVAEFIAGKSLSARDITELPMKWLHTHILTVDRECCQYLSAQGLR